MRHISYIIVCVVMVLSSVACGRQHSAKQAVEEFMESNLKEPSTLTALHFEHFDSTRHITDSVVAVLRHTVSAAAKQYKADVKYADIKPTQSTVFIHATYQCGGKHYADTYYLDQELTGVVAFMSRED